MRDLRVGSPYAEQVERAEAFVVSIGEEVAYWGDVVQVPDEPDAIEAESCDGFIAWTNGGFDLCIMADLSAAQGSGSVPTLIQPYLDRAMQDCREEFCKHRGISEEVLDALWHEEKTPELLEEFYDFEHEYMNEGGAYFYKARAVFYAADNCDNRSGEDEVYLAFFLNTDFEYGRDKANITIWSENIPLAEFTEERAAAEMLACLKAIRAV